MDGNFTDHGLLALEATVNVEEAFISSRREGVTGQTLRSIGAHHSLRVLHLANATISDDDLRVLDDHPTLESLTFDARALTDECFHTFATIPKLRGVMLLGGYAISDSAVHRYLDEANNDCVVIVAADAIRVIKGDGRRGSDEFDEYKPE
jgi:hypothetical protein